LERKESVRNTSGESLPLYTIKGGPSEGKTEAPKTSVCEEVTDPDSGRE